MKITATYQPSDTATNAAPSRRWVADQRNFTNPRLNIEAKSANDMFVDREALATSKHRFRRPEDSSP